MEHTGRACEHDSTAGGQASPLVCGFVSHHSSFVWGWRVMMLSTVPSFLTVTFTYFWFVRVGYRFGERRPLLAASRGRPPVVDDFNIEQRE